MNGKCLHWFNFNYEPNRCKIVCRLAIAACLVGVTRGKCLIDKHTLWIHVTNAMIIHDAYITDVCFILKTNKSSTYENDPLSTLSILILVKFIWKKKLNKNTKRNRNINLKRVHIYAFIVFGHEHNNCIYVVKMMQLMSSMHCRESRLGDFSYECKINAREDSTHCQFI